ncbi:MAG TPA: glycosyltransferase family 39 protein [Terriglobia bacterium]|nr:glycosyltransferase family 39 protein [Terriglobia bacterium]
MNTPTRDQVPSKDNASQPASPHQSESITIPEKSLMDCSLALALFVGSCLYLVPFYNYTTMFSDEGIFLQGAQRILQGQILYRDFFSLFTPGSFYGLALLFRIFGSSILVARAALIVYGGAFSVLTYLVARRVCTRLAGLVTACLATITCLPYYFMALHNWDSTLWAYVGLYCAVRSLESRQRAWPMLMGTFAAFTCLCEQPRGAGLVFGMGLGLVLIGWYRERRISINWRFLSTLTAGFAWPLVATFVYFGMQRSLQPMLADWFWPLKNYAAGNRAFYGQVLLPSSDLHMLLSGPLLAGLIAIFALAPCFIIPALPILAVGILAFGLFQLWRRRESQDVSSYYVLVSATLVGLLLSTLATGRPDLVHIMVQAPLFLLVLAWGLGGRGFQSPLLTALRPLAGTVITLSFAAFGLALLWAPLNARYILRTRRGDLKAAGPDAVLEELLARVRSGTRIYVYPNQPLYYYLAAADNPTRYDDLGPGVSTPEEFQEALLEVEKDRTPVVLFEPGYIQRLPVSRSSIPLTVMAARDFGAEYFPAHYKNCKTLNSGSQNAIFVLMVRKDLSCDGPF